MAVVIVKEITSGSSATLALDAAQGAGGGTGLRIQRAWKIVFDAPTDYITVDVRNHIGVTVGSAHPTMPICACDSIDVKPDGESRHAYIVTANYSSKALSLQDGGFGSGNSDPRTQSPQARKANWSTDVSTIEAPSWVWRPRFKQGLGFVNEPWSMAVNPVGDLYDGVVTMQPIVTIRVEQLQQRDPNNWALYVGYVNSNPIQLGALDCIPRSVLLRGISATPHIEVVGSQAWRGWKANYEFVYKPGYNSYLNEFIGWDVAIPVSGWNVKNVAGALADPTVEKGALALKLTNDTAGSIAGWPNAPAIEPSLVGKISRANVLIAAPDSKATQRPSAQPVPLNWNGTPRNVDPNQGGLKPLIQVSQVYADVDFSLLNLKLD
jgi:hypothetical protein